ncbi:MAG: cobalamin biosynthesis protein [Clostridiales bacterium]|nr:cobalamin biosynthesis protein [Clostridiales bacterium]
MRVSVISFTLQGGRMACRIRDCFGKGSGEEEKRKIELYALPKYASVLGQCPVESGLQEWCRQHWETEELLIFVGASGIAVRTIAPMVKSKVTDPAVLVLDERGKFVISLLSGHLGGGNQWALELAEGLSAIPVITTATDVEGKFAVDVWAKENRLAIHSMKTAKAVSAAVLHGKPVGFYCEGEILGNLPPELEEVTDPKAWLAGSSGSDKTSMERNESGIRAEQGEESEGQKPGMLVAVTPCCPDYLSERVLWLIPRCMVLGVGCRKETSCEILEKQVSGWLKENGIPWESIVQAASIDWKKEETGILELCSYHDIPFSTYSADELMNIPGDFSSSLFVKRTTGADNVCERSAVLASKQGRLRMVKQAGNGVTAAAAEKRWRVRF